MCTMPLLRLPVRSTGGCQQAGAACSSSQQWQGSDPQRGQLSAYNAFNLRCQLGAGAHACAGKQGAVGAVVCALAHSLAPPGAVTP
jgi:hypothetical protein